MFPEIALEIASIVAPVFLLASVGYGWVKAGYDYDVAFVTRMATNVATPALVFSTLVHVELPADAVGRMTLASVLVLAAMVALNYGCLRAFRLEPRIWLTPMTFGNTGNLGIPLALFAFGEPGLAFAILFFAVGTIVFFTWGVWWVSGETSFARVMATPIVYATPAGLLAAAYDWTPPLFLDRAIGLAGQIAIPLMLITLGVAIARLTARGVGRAFLLSLARLAIGLAAGIGTAWALGLQGAEAGVLILECAAPVAVFNYLFSERYGRAPEEVAGLVLISTLIAVATIPIVLSFLI